MLTPLARKSGYRSASAWLLVLSTRTTGCGAAARWSATVSSAGTGRVDAARAVSQAENGIGVYSVL
jgi:hypothetical protein